MLDIRNCDNMDLMREFPDKYFDLAIVDPPYGLKGKSNTPHPNGNNKNSLSKFPKTEWDNEIPSPKYFKELFRVSKNQIIWGGNYFPLPPHRGFIIWDKMVFIPTMSRIEQAYTSFDRLPQLVQINNTDPNRIHVTQKPITLYKWLLKHYAKEGDKILDTHLGSGSSAIACHDYGFDLTACEIDSKKFKDAKKRINQHLIQIKLFI